MAVGKDRETGPCRKDIVNNRGDSSAKGRDLFVNQHFLCPFQFGIFGLTTYLPTDREKSRDSGFCAPESLGIYQLTCFSNLSLSFSAAISAFIWRIISASSCSHSSLVLV